MQPQGSGHLQGVVPGAMHCSMGHPPSVVKGKLPEGGREQGWGLRGLSLGARVEHA